MEFDKLLAAAQQGNKDACAQIYEMYTPLLQKYARIEGRLDEDLYQELCIVLMDCIKRAKLEPI